MSRRTFGGLLGAAHERLGLLCGFLLVEEAGGWFSDPSNWVRMIDGGAVVAGCPGVKADLLRIVEAHAV